MIIRDTIAIKSVGTYIKKASTELLELKTIFEKQIKLIEDQYKGIDSSKIINNLENSINDLNLYIENISYYGEYMLSLSEHDIDVLEKTRKKILSIGANNE